MRPRTCRAASGLPPPLLLLLLLLLGLVALGGTGCGATVEEKFEGDPCTLASGEAGVCRRSSACGWLRAALLQKRLTTDRIVRCGFDRDELIVCCRSVETTVVSGVGVRLAEEACGNYDGVHSSLAFHILEGVQAVQGEVPFIGALGYRVGGEERGPGEYRWGCGSSLIAPSFLLTAAHCIVSQFGRPEVVKMGALNLLEPLVEEDVQERTVKNVIMHPAYSPSRKYDDIALVEVDRPFLFETAVKPACLSTSAADRDPAEYLLAAGWGRTATHGSSPEALFLANLTTVPVAACWEPYAALNFGKRKPLPDGIRPSQYCALGVLVGEHDRTDTCEGDSGGPLYYVAGGEGMPKYYLLGITSFGLNCGSTLPSIYTRVSHYLDWIVSHVWPAPTR